MRNAAKAAPRWIAAAAALAMLTACGGRHHLNQYEFRDKTLGLVFMDPPEPELLHSIDYVDANDNVITAVVRAGAGVAKEVAARRATARLDSAAKRVDIETLLAARTLDRASRYLGTRAVTPSTGADFVLEVTMKSFGIDARSNNATYLFARAEAVLIDRRTGREIWSEDVRGTDRLTPIVEGAENLPGGSIVSAGTLQTVTVAQFQQALEQLTTYTSSLITNELREKLRDARDR
jgi:hypothetical protein